MPASFVCGGVRVNISVLSPSFTKPRSMMKILVAGEVCPRMHALDSVLFAKLAAGENARTHSINSRGDVKGEIYWCVFTL